MKNDLWIKNKIHKTAAMSYFLGTIFILVALDVIGIDTGVLKFIPIEMDHEQKLLAQEILVVLLLIHVMPYFLKFFYIKKINNFFIKIINFNNTDFKQNLYYILSLLILIIIYFLKIINISSIDISEYFANGVVSYDKFGDDMYDTLLNLDDTVDFLLLDLKYKINNTVLVGVYKTTNCVESLELGLELNWNESDPDSIINIVPDSVYFKYTNLLKLFIINFFDTFNNLLGCVFSNKFIIYDGSYFGLLENLNEVSTLPQTSAHLVLKFIDQNVFLDGISLWLVWLTALVGFVLAISGYKKNILIDNLFFKKYYVYNKLLNFIILLMFVCFLTKDIFIFFTAFEMILIPLFSYIILQGSRLNKIFAVKYLFIYTIVGSLFLWYGISYIIEIVGSTNYDNVRWILLNSTNTGSKKIIFISLFLGFAFKVPLVPFHHWLIIAHVEAPTSGSIILAALLLKVGGYGLYRFVFNLFPIEVFEFSNEIMALSLFGFTYATAMAIRQVDVKRYIAYTSIAHMNYALLGLFSCQDVGILGYIHIMVSHGIIATAMFFLIGHVYSSLSFRDTLRLSGLAYIFPKFSVFFFIFSLANMGLPLFSGFPGEFLILVAIISTNEFYGFVVLFGFMLSGIYNFFQLNKILFSGYSNSIYLKKNSDLGSNSILVLTTLLFWSIAFGISPDIIIQNVEL